MKIHTPIVLITLMVLPVVNAQTVLTIPNTFSNGGIIDADQINQNFSAISSAINNNTNNLPKMPVLKDQNDVFVGFYLTSIQPVYSALSSPNVKNFFITPKGFVGSFGLLDGGFEIKNDGLQFDGFSPDSSELVRFYTSIDCSGQSYIRFNQDNNYNGNIYKIDNLYYYVLRNPSVSRNIQSRKIGITACASMSQSLATLEIIPNDELITGFSDLVSGGIHFSEP